ncbi:MAG: hypothetical protein WD708_06680 [Kiritimatiellia bacterium]
MPAPLRPRVREQGGHPPIRDHIVRGAPFEVGTVLEVDLDERKSADVDGAMEGAVGVEVF